MAASGQYFESISMPENLGIRNIADIHAVITSKLAVHSALSLDIPDDAEADLSFVQLVEAARLQAKTSGKSRYTLLVHLACCHNGHRRTVAPGVQLAFLPPHIAHRHDAHGPRAGARGTDGKMTPCPTTRLQS